MSNYHHVFTPAGQGPAHTIYHSGNVSARIDFLSERLLRVAVLPDGAHLPPTYSVQPGNPVPRQGRDRLSLEGFPLFTPERDGDFSFSWGEYRLRVEPVNFLLTFDRNGAPLLRDRAPLAVNLGGEFGRGQRHYLVRETSEQIFGLGDKSGDLDKSGRRFRLDSCDAMGYDAASSDPLYHHVPFYICKNPVGTVGIFYDTHASCAFDFGAEISNYTGAYRYVSIDEDGLVYYLLLGSLPQIVTGFSALTGGSAFPPKRSLLYWGSTMAYTDAPDADAQLRGFAETCLNDGFSCGGFYLSSGYTSVGRKRCVFHWNNQKIPDPKALSKFFSERGMDFIANIKPVFLTDHPLYASIAENGWFLQNPDGTPALTPFWDGLGSFLDFTNPGAYDFWKDQVKTQLLDNGIPYTWNDNNEYEVLDERVLANGFGSPYPAYRMKPVFAMLMNRASLEAQAEHAGLQKRQLVSSRSGAAGICRMAATWSGDNRTEWNTLRYNHKMGLTMSLSGLYLFGHDIGGFAGRAPEKELFLRWLQHGVLTPRFVIHSWNDDGCATTPWFYPDAIDAVKRIFAFRQRILPYLYDALYRAHAFFEPVLRPLVYEDPHSDPESDLFMVGDGLLAACVFDENVTELAIMLPPNPDGWYTDKGVWVAENAELLLDCPVGDAPRTLHRAGSVFVEDMSAYPSSGPEQPLFTVYAAQAGEFTREFFNDDGETYAYRQNECARVRFHVVCKEDAVYVAFQNFGKALVEPQIRLIDRWNRTLKTEVCNDAASHA